MSTAYRSDEEDGFDIVDEIEVGDLSDQQGGVMEPVTRVPFVIKKATVRVQEDKDTKIWTVKRLAIEAQISAEGTDGEGKYKNKVVFQDFILVFNATDFPEKFAKDWWKTQARYPTKAFFKALGLDITGIRINDDFLIELQGREFVADIKKKAKQDLVDGKYVNNGEFTNELDNFRAAAGGES